MVRPQTFRSNEETMVNNYFQNANVFLPNVATQKAQNEFDALAKKLKLAGVTVLVFEHDKNKDVPDALFPNNWISFHDSGTAVVYPMFAENRRQERTEALLELVEKNGFVINSVLDYTEAEEEDVFLEGTGSIVLDRVHKIAYCALSPRSDEDLFVEFCEDMEYTPVVFRAFQEVDNTQKEIYHTNVVMSVGTSFCVVCLESISDKKERKHLVSTLKSTGKNIIAITSSQMHQFAGNILELKSSSGDAVIVMSDTARKSFTVQQLEQIEKQGKIISSSIETIETLGGGSVRCMIAEVFLPKS